MLTSRDLARGRADIAETMFDTGVIMRPTAGSAYVDAAGHFVDTTGAVGTALMRLDPLTQREKDPFYGEQEAGKSLFQLTAPYDTTLYVADTIVINGITVNVLQVHREHSDRLVIRAVCAKVAN